MYIYIFFTVRDKLLRMWISSILFFIECIVTRQCRARAARGRERDISISIYCSNLPEAAGAHVHGTWLVCGT